MSCSVQRSVSDSVSCNHRLIEEARKDQSEVLKPVDLHTKLILAQKEAQLWKTRYYILAAEKIQQLSAIEANLLRFESHLQAEKRDLEKRFQEQQMFIENQKKKSKDQEQKNEEQSHEIETLTTANHKLLNVLMTMSQSQHELKSNKSGRIPETPSPKIEKITKAKTPPPLPIKSNDTKPTRLSSSAEVETNEDRRIKTKEKKHRSSSRRKQHARTHRSKSLPLNALNVFLQTSTSFTTAATSC